MPHSEICCGVQMKQAQSEGVEKKDN
jgi:hypothetical protein